MGSWAHLVHLSQGLGPIVTKQVVADICYGCVQTDSCRLLTWNVVVLPLSTVAALTGAEFRICEEDVGLLVNAPITQDLRLLR